VSMVRYDDGSLLDAARVADACHKQGRCFCWTSASAAVHADGCQPTGRDFMVCAGYKWLLGPFRHGVLLGQEREI